MSRKDFYKKKILEHIKNKNSKILVLGAGKLDIDLFSELKYKNVNFTNVDYLASKKKIKLQNIHEIKYKDNSFDYCVAHACIHHSSRPHQAVLELYRVCNLGCLIIEAKESILSRIACRFNWSEEFEISAVYKNKLYGGVDNTTIPNYVFRWSEREVEKLMKSYKPEIIHSIEYGYGHHIKFTNSTLIQFLFRLFFFFFPKQQNLFSFFIENDKKKKQYQSWYKKL